MLPSTPPDPQVKITQLALCTKKFPPKKSICSLTELHQKTSKNAEIEPRNLGDNKMLSSHVWPTGKDIHDKGIIGKSLGPKGVT